MKKALYKLGLVMVMVALLAAACTPASVEVPIEVTRIVEGETVVEQVIGPGSARGKRDPARGLDHAQLDH